MLDELLYQDRAVTILRRVAEGHFSSPVLLVGPEGTGKRFASLQVTRALFCQASRTSDCSCYDCSTVRQGTHPDLLMVSSLFGKDIGVEAVRDLIHTVQQMPTQAPLRVVIVDGADRFTTAAANALLKTLEEPPSRVRFFLLAESKARVIPTILSRCGVITFGSLPENFLVSRILPFEADPTKALVYARLGEGSVGRAIQYCGSAKLSFRDKVLGLLTMAHARDIQGVLSGVDQLDKELPLALRFGSILIHDVLMLDVDRNRVVNQDVLPALSKLTGKSEQWSVVRRELDTLADTTVRIQLAFHVKSVLLDAFA